MSKREHGTADDEGGGKRARGPDPGKIFQLFPKLNAEKRAALQFDDEALFSVTDQRSAERINRVILALDGVDAARSRIVDGCACVGGNVIAFGAMRIGFRGNQRAIVENFATRVDIVKDPFTDHPYPQDFSTVKEFDPPGTKRLMQFRKAAMEQFGCSCLHAAYLTLLKSIGKELGQALSQGDMEDVAVALGWPAVRGTMTFGQMALSSAPRGL